MGSGKLVISVIRDLVTGAYQEKVADGKVRPQGRTDKRRGIEAEGLKKYPTNGVGGALWFWNWESRMFL